ncbi:hypothetical protein ANCCAN_18410 [Ancylostoma caninum]|uniref:Peptidase M13 N-terminal domain-containing protein n=1 Tax=Ancylostoma caninum TaxID=29170 RepID=A0A368FU50_ANCCA|nr:hypothetical protein ANCCAN_18410 [Ancylostoma caninum]
MIDLETALARIIVPEEDRRDFNRMYNIRRLSDMQKLMPLVDWPRYFHSIAPYVVYDYLASNPEILIVELDYMRRVTQLLQLTDPRIIANYVYMRYTSSWDGELGERYEDISQVTTFLTDHSVRSIILVRHDTSSAFGVTLIPRIP